MITIDDIIALAEKVKEDECLEIIHTKGIPVPSFGDHIPMRLFLERKYIYDCDIYFQDDTVCFFNNYFKFNIDIQTIKDIKIVPKQRKTEYEALKNFEENQIKAQALKAHIIKTLGTLAIKSEAIEFRVPRNIADDEINELINNINTYKFTAVEIEEDVFHRIVRIV